MPVTTPYFSPAWLKRMTRMQTPSTSKQPDMNNPQQAAMGLFDAGIQIGADGIAQPTQDFGGMMGKASGQINSLSRGTRGGQFSSLGKPLNTMYEQNPGFFGGGSGQQSFAEQIAQRNQMNAAAPAGDRSSRIAAAKEAGTFEGIRTQFNERAKSFGQMMDEAGNIQMSSMPAAGAPTQADMNRQRLEEGIAGRKLMEEASGAPRVTIPTIERPLPGGSMMQSVPMAGAKNIEGRYGRGFATASGIPGQPRSEGLIGGRPFSEVLQGLANKPGIARPGDKFQPQTLTPAQNKTLQEAAKKTPRR